MTDASATMRDDTSVDTAAERIASAEMRALVAVLRAAVVTTSVDARMEASVLSAAMREEASLDTAREREASTEMRAVASAETAVE